MDYKWLLSRFDGRIGRARYWLATLAILCSMLAGLTLLSVVCDAFDIATGPLAIDIIGISASIDPADGDNAVRAALFPQVATILMTPVFARFTSPAPHVMRAHD